MHCLRYSNVVVLHSCLYDVVLPFVTQHHGKLSVNLFTAHYLLYFCRYPFLKMEIREGMSNVQVPLTLVLKKGTAELNWYECCSVTVKPGVSCGQVASHHLGLNKYICRVHKAATTTENFPTLKVYLQDEGKSIFFMLLSHNVKCSFQMLPHVQMEKTSEMHMFQTTS